MQTASEAGVLMAHRNQMLRNINHDHSKIYHVTSNLPPVVACWTHWGRGRPLRRWQARPLGYHRKRRSQILSSNTYLPGAGEKPVASVVWR